MSAKQKGSSGEREAARWLKANLGIELPERNLNQTRDGGADLIFWPFCIEVKRCESLSLDNWWVQVTHAEKQLNLSHSRVVMFRQNRKQWEFLISANEIGVDKGFIRLSGRIFSEYAALILEGA